ncbi:unnamed protein product [Orchesella dallaii]|uniref:Uncharacterized protein n=1 Tax=Orchesella dallaii TaxID=48710 RepID=A0ABP1Q6S4_9HEXA
MASDVFSCEMLDEQVIPMLMNQSSMSGMDHSGEYDDNDINMRDVETVAVVRPEPVWNTNTTIRIPNFGDEELPIMVGEEDGMNPELFMESEEQICEAETMERFPVVYPLDMMGISRAQGFYNVYGCEFIQQINEAEREGRRKLEKRKQEEDEEIQIRKRLEGLQKETEYYNKRKARLQTRSNETTADYEKRIKKAEKLLRRTTKSLKVAKAEENKLQLKIRDTNKLYIEGSKLTAQIDEWMKSHGIKIVIPDTSNSSTNDSQESENEASACDSALIIIINKIHPEFPEKEYKIRLNHIEEESASLMFDALSVLPTFEGAFEVLQAANESQNFPKLMVDCKNGWKKESNNESPKCNGFGGEQTVPLFDSPESMSSNGST